MQGGEWPLVLLMKQITWNQVRFWIFDFCLWIDGRFVCRRWHSLLSITWTLSFFFKKFFPLPTDLQIHQIFFCFNELSKTKNSWRRENRHWLFFWVFAVIFSWCWCFNDWWNCYFWWYQWLFFLSEEKWWWNTKLWTIIVSLELRRDKI